MPEPEAPYEVVDFHSRVHLASFVVDEIRGSAAASGVVAEASAICCSACREGAERVELGLGSLGEGFRVLAHAAV